MKSIETKVQDIRWKVDNAIRNNKFITWELLGINQFDVHYNLGFACYNKSFEAEIVKGYMDELGFKYGQYNAVFSDKKIHGAKKGFYDDNIEARRKRKLLHINERNKN